MPLLGRHPSQAPQDFGMCDLDTKRFRNGLSPVNTYHNKEKDMRFKNTSGKKCRRQNWRMRIVVIGVLACMSTVNVVAVEKYIDSETGHEVWRMTHNNSDDRTYYYTSNGFSPNGQYIVYHSKEWVDKHIKGAKFCAIMNADGTNSHPLANFKGTGVGWLDSYPAGCWSKDSRYYYLNGSTYYVEAATGKVGQISKKAAPFYWPFLSPDGRKLCGMSIAHDSKDGSGGSIKIVNIDTAACREYKLPWQGPGNRVDVTHSWIGNNHVYYQSGLGKRRMHPVMDIATGKLAGFISAGQPDEDNLVGRPGHPTFSPDAYMLGNGAGLVSSHGNGFEFMNMKYWIRDRKKRAIRSIVDKEKYPEFRKPIGSHANFSPDGKWLVVENTNSDMGKMALYPVDRKSKPIWLVRFRSKKRYTGGVVGRRPYPQPNWSPDGTKVLYWANQRDKGPGELYVVVVKKPDAPCKVVAKKIGGRLHLNWKSGAFHREIKEYLVLCSEVKKGPFKVAASIPALYTYVDAPCKIGKFDKKIHVDSTRHFPIKGVIEIAGLSTQQPSEMISYTGRTSRAFSSCKRGASSTRAAEHWNDAFVWSCIGKNGVTASLGAKAVWCKVRAMEWSGLYNDSHTVRIIK